MINKLERQPIQDDGLVYLSPKTVEEAADLLRRRVTDVTLERA
jgi:hypothetical protein